MIYQNTKILFDRILDSREKTKIGIKCLPEGRFITVFNKKFNHRWLHGGFFVRFTQFLKSEKIYYLLVVYTEDVKSNTPV